MHIIVYVSVTLIPYVMQVWVLFYCEFRVVFVVSGLNYGCSSVMIDQIYNLTEQSFPEICRNDWSLNETIWTPKCDKLSECVWHDGGN